MKNFKYILSILFVFLGAFSGDLKAEIVIVDNDEIESYSEQDFKETSTEIEWLSLLYLQEGSHTQNQYLSFFILIESSRQNFSEEVCLKSKVETSRNEFQFLQTSSSHQRKWEEVDKVYIGYAELVDSWKVLGESTDLRKNIDALETIEYYTKNVNGNIDELTDAFKTASNKEDWFSGIIAEIRSKARSLPRTSKGNGVVIEGQWMRGTDGNIGLFPKQIAEKLKGRQFQNFAEFRSEFWKAVADDPDLFSQFSRASQAEMLKGNAPFAKKAQQVGGKIKYEIHHKTPIHDGGEVYDIDNLVIVTPRYHKEILDPAYHLKK